MIKYSRLVKAFIVYHCSNLFFSYDFPMKFTKYNPAKIDPELSSILWVANLSGRNLCKTPAKEIIFSKVAGLNWKVLFNTDFSLFLTVQPWTKYCIKFTNLGKIGFSMECFTAYFSQFSSTTVKICLSGRKMGNRH